ncbi:MAG: disulfide bond formation protein B [Acetobacteraceae bacterium]
MQRSAHRLVGLAALLAGVVALAIALGSERLLGLDPCALCLRERWVWWAIVGLGVIAALLPRLPGKMILGLVGLVLLASVAVAFIHVGVENGLWPSPLPECAAPHISGHTLAQLLASMPARPSKPCDAPTYLIPGLPLSMAAMNLIYSLAALGLLAFYMVRSRKAAR